jgi:hypothetical protein
LLYLNDFFIIKRLKKKRERILKFAALALVAAAG